jgi:hypothetical protein
MNNEIVGRLYYNRNKSHSFNNLGLGIPNSTKNKNFFSPMMGNSKEKSNDEEYKTTNNYADKVTTTQGNFLKKNSMGAVGGSTKNELNDFNAFLEKLSNYENKKGGHKKY